MKNKPRIDFSSHKHLPLVLGISLACARFISLLSSTPESFRSYSDFIYYFQVSSLPGWPFLQYWVEYPPVFPFILVFLNQLSGGQQHVFDYLLTFVLLLADAGNLYLFTRLAYRVFEPRQAVIRSGIYLLVLAVLAYGWWYFDPMVVFFMLLGLTLLLEGKLWRSGLALAVGAMLKFFPLLALAAAWRRQSWKHILALALLALLPLVVSYALLWQISPEFTGASLRSQSGKGSWETVWALLDGNIRTGSFGPIEERVDPTLVSNSTGQPPLVNPLISLGVFAAIGLAAILRFHPHPDPRIRDRQSLALVGLAWSLFVLWSPGWSPQWVLYFLPLILLVLPVRQAVLFSLLLILINLLEWPVLLSRGLFDLIWAPIVLRTVLLLILAGSFYNSMARVEEQAQPVPQESETG